MYTPTKQSGFSLIEILVGMTIGLVVILVIMQTMSLFETQRKTSSSASDMQSNGLLSLFSLEQDVRMAGYGLIVNYGGRGDLPCVKINGYGTAPGVFNATPISINTSGVLDSITITRMDADAGGLTTGGAAARVSDVLGIPTKAALLAAAGVRLNVAPGVFAVSNVLHTTGRYTAGAVNTTGFTYVAASSPADTVLISSAPGVAAPLDCSLVRVLASSPGSAYVPEVLNTGSPVFPVDALGNTSAVGFNGVKVVGSFVLPMSPVTPAQPASSVLSFEAVNNAGLDTTIAPTFPAGGYPTGSLLHNLGVNPTFTRTIFAVNALGQFTKQTNNLPAEIIADNIVAMQAQYGTAAVGSSTINCWVNPTAANTNTCAAAAATDWTPAGLQANKATMRRIKAIRVAIVARNNLREKASQGACTTTQNAPISWLNGPVIDLTANPEWQCYRYKVYQTIVPLHNMILGNL